MCDWFQLSQVKSDYEKCVSMLHETQSELNATYNRNQQQNLHYSLLGAGGLGPSLAPFHQSELTSGALSTLSSPSACYDRTTTKDHRIESSSASAFHPISSSRVSHSLILIYSYLYFSTLNISSNVTLRRTHMDGCGGTRAEGRAPLEVDPG